MQTLKQWGLLTAAALLASLGLIGAASSALPAIEGSPPATYRYAQPLPPPMLPTFPFGAITPVPPPTPTPTPTPTPEATPTAAPTATPTYVFVAVPAPTPTPPPPPPTPAPAQLAPFASGLLSATNDARALVGLPPLSVNAALTTSSEDYAALMAQYNWFDHLGPDGSTSSSRAQAAGYTGGWLGEILYKGPTSDSPTQIVVAWLESSSHKGVILGSQFVEVGIGCAVAGDLRWCVETLGAP